MKLFIGLVRGYYAPLRDWLSRRHAFMNAVALALLCILDNRERSTHGNNSNDRNSEQDDTVSKS